MLPSKGYFSNSICPYYSRRECSRAYCHYRHSRESPDQAEKNEEFIKKAIENKVKEMNGQVKIDSMINSIIRDLRNQENSEHNTTQVPYYNPTPISELNRRQIPPNTRPTYSHMVKSKTTIQQDQEFHQMKKENNSILKVDRNNRQTSLVHNNGDVCNFIYDGNPDRKCFSTIEHCNINSELMSVDNESVSAPDLLCYSKSLEKADSHITDTRGVYSEFQKNAIFSNLPDGHSKGARNEIVRSGNSVPTIEYNNLKIMEEALNTENLIESIVQVTVEPGIRKQNKYAKVHEGPHQKKHQRKSSKKHDFSTCEKRKTQLEIESSKKLKVQNYTNERIEGNNGNGEVVNVYETITISSESNSPTSEENSTQDSPPPKRMKQSSAEDRPPMSSISEPLCERWRKAREAIGSRNRSKGKLKINPVANVEVLLKAKNHIAQMKGELQQDISIDANDQILEYSSPRKIVRKSRIPLEVSKKCPNIVMEENLNIPIYVRQVAIKNLFDEFCKYKESTEAYEDAQKLELELCKRVHITKTYKNAIAVAVLRIRKQKGLVFDRQAPKEVLRSNTIPSFANGWTMYKCFSEYLLSSEQYKRNGFPMKIPTKRGCAYIEVSARRTKPRKPSDKRQQICDHCSQQYRVDEKGVPVKEFDCFYHWGKVRRLKVCGGFVEKFTCCGGDTDSDPCTNGKYHVCNLFDEDLLEGFVTTRSQKQGESLDTAGIYGIDCEMCYTTKGIELTRCTLVDLNGRTVYDKIVVPENPIIDYCTRFSGITEEIIKTSNLCLKDIQKDLLAMINAKTILVGHSLENDLKVLKIFHDTLVDTSVIFPHKNGLPFKLSLKKLAKDLLNLTIQENENGHDSYEDANTCIRIMLWKIKEDAKKRKPRIIISLESNNKR